VPGINTTHTYNGERAGGKGWKGEKSVGKLQTSGYLTPVLLVRLLACHSLFPRFKGITEAGIYIMIGIIGLSLPPHTSSFGFPAA
jgi:hypothetical protein